MSLATSIYTFLSGRSPQLSTAIYPLKLPLDHQTFPAIVYTIDDDEDIQLLTGGVSTLGQARVSLDVYDLSYNTAHNTADVIETAMVGYNGSFGTHTARQIDKIRRFDLYETDTRLNHVSLQFLLSYV